ncbi:phytanoyl-CoA dioxygenase family protein, partial [Escherichia coli]|nr:phytanoyl-CoA dioxygenase family protein [Escherichia coli]
RLTMGVIGNLDSNQVDFFNSNGYLVLESFSSPDEVQMLRLRMDQLLDDFDCSSRASIFSTKNQVLISKDVFSLSN